MYYLTFDLDLGVIQNITQYPLHYVIYASAKFEVATSNGLGELRHQVTFDSQTITMIGIMVFRD